jgi:hypothetical protein
MQDLADGPFYLEALSYASSWMRSNSTPNLIRVTDFLTIGDGPWSGSSQREIEQVGKAGDS